MPNRAGAAEPTAGTSASAASRADTSGPVPPTAAAVAMMMKMLTMSERIAPLTVSIRSAGYCSWADLLVDDRRGDVELHVRRDRRPDQATTRTRNVVECTNCGVSRSARADDARVRVREDRRCRVHDEREREHERDLLALRVVAEHGQCPEPDERDRYGDVSGDAEELHGRLRSRRTRSPSVRSSRRREGSSRRRRAERELLADERPEPFSGVGAEARAHLLDDNEGDRDDHHHEERAVGELRAGARVGEYAARVVSGIGAIRPGPRSRRTRARASAAGVGGPPARRRCSSSRLPGDVRGELRALRGRKVGEDGLELVEARGASSAARS